MFCVLLFSGGMLKDTVGQTTNAFFFSLFFRNQVLEMFDHAYSNYMVRKVPVCFLFFLIVMADLGKKATFST